MSRQTTVLVGVLLVLYALVLVESCSPKSKEEPKSVSTPAAFVGSVSCKSCHAKPYADWQLSDHFRAMQEPTDSTVLGDFNDRSFTADGVKSRFFRKDGKYFINTEGNDGQNHDYQVLYTFGFFPLQQYLVAAPGGRMQATRVSWDSREKKWFHQYHGDKIFHRDWLHWTGGGQNWNTMCASCHSTNLQKNYTSADDSYTTTFDEINVTCESCHGPASKHVAFVQSEGYKAGERILNMGLHYGKEQNPQLQLNTCATCHARKADIAPEQIRQGEILDDMIPQVISNEFYFADGQIREEDYEYGSFAQSKMFHNNVRCSSCHNPHSGKLQLSGNDQCMSCHKPEYNTKAHTFHLENTEASMCISCHMPAKTFMGNDLRRDHSFRVPRPDQSVVYATPNSCSGCHTDKSAQWAAEAIEKRYGKNRVYHFSDDLLPGSLLNDKSEGHLVKLLRDTTQPEIVRATAASYLGNVVTRMAAGSLVDAVKDSKPMVRYHALRSLENFPPEQWQEKAYSGLKDKTRAVRIAAADLYHRLPAESIPAEARGAYASADAENRRYLHYQTDFAVGNVMLADYELQGGDQVNAIAHYLRGLKKDSLMNYARFNLSALYNATGKNAEALRVLQEAAAIDPRNDRTYYSLALLYYEMGDVKKTEEAFRQAMGLGTLNIGVYYNYGLLLQQQGKMQQAEDVLLRGYRLDPQAPNINYALAFLYLNQRQPEKALPHAKVLRLLDPQNPDYQAMFNSLRI